MYIFKSIYRNWTKHQHICEVIGSEPNIAFCLSSLVTGYVVIAVCGLHLSWIQQLISLSFSPSVLAVLLVGIQVRLSSLVNAAAADWSSIILNGSASDLVLVKG